MIATFEEDVSKHALSCTVAGEKADIVVASTLIFLPAFSSVHFQCTSYTASLSGLSECFF